MKKVAEPKPICLNPEHLLPGNIVLSPGKYEHTCPGCKNKTTFEIPLVTF